MHHPSYVRSSCSTAACLALVTKATEKESSIQAFPSVLNKGKGSSAAEHERVQNLSSLSGMFSCRGDGVRR